MTVSGTKTAAFYLGNGVTAAFDFDFIIPSGALAVTVDGREVSSGITVSGLGDPAGGSIVFDVPPSHGARIEISRSVPITQDRTFVNGQAIYAKEIEGALDQLTLTAQELYGGLKRAIKVPLGVTETPEELAESLLSAEATAVASAASAITARGGAEASAQQAMASQAASLDSQMQAAGSAEVALSAQTAAEVSYLAVESYCAAAQTSAAEASAAQVEASAAALVALDSAAGAASSALAAATARDSALAALDSFDDRYLGAQNSPPTVDKDGDALVAGALYFDTVDQCIKLWTGTAWVAAYVSGSGFLAANSNLADLTNVPAARSALGLADVAASGSYDDLGDRPDLSGYLSDADLTTHTVTYAQRQGPASSLSALDGIGLSGWGETTHAAALSDDPLGVNAPFPVYGFNYVMPTVNGPPHGGTQGGGVMRFSAGVDAPETCFDVLIPRSATGADGATLWTRQFESGTWGDWSKLNAGNADTVGGFSAVGLGAVRKWVVYNQVTGTISASAGVSSVTDHATGQLTVDFATPWVTAAYCPAGLSKGDPGYIEVFGVEAETSPRWDVAGIRICHKTTGSVDYLDCRPGALTFAGTM